MSLPSFTQRGRVVRPWAVGVALGLLCVVACQQAIAATLKVTPTKTGPADLLLSGGTVVPLPNVVGAIETTVTTATWDAHPNESAIVRVYDGSTVAETIGPKAYAETVEFTGANQGEQMEKLIDLVKTNVVVSALTLGCLLLSATLRQVRV